MGSSECKNNVHETVKQRLLLMDIGPFSVSSGGAQTFNKILVSQLSKDYDFQIVSNFYTDYTAAQELSNNVLLLFLEKLLNKIRLGSNNKFFTFLSSVFPHALKLILFVKKVRRIIRIYSPDVVILSGPWFNDLFVLFFSKVRSTKILSVLHEANPMKYPGIPLSAMLITLLIRNISSTNELKFITLNERTKEYIKGMFRNEVEEIGVLVDTKKFAPAPWKERDNIILYIGRLDESQKNISLLIRTFKRLPINGIRLIIAGSGPDGNFYESLITSLNLQSLVELKGNISENEKISLLSKAKIFVNPSIAEGQSNSVLEAMSSGCLVICVDNWGTRSTIRDGVNGLISNNNEDDLQNTIMKALNNPTKSYQMSLSARNDCLTKYDMIKVIGKYDDSIRKLIDNNE